MPESHDFADLIRLVRRGNENAAAEVVRQFEPSVLRFVRFQMRRRADRDRLGPQVGASDICQSVLQSFFQRARSGRYDLTGPVELEKLLKTMARLHIASEGRKASVVLCPRLRRRLGERARRHESRTRETG